MFSPKPPASSPIPIALALLRPSSFACESTIAPGPMAISPAALDSVSTIPCRGNFDVRILHFRRCLHMGERIFHVVIGFTADGIAWLFDSAILIQSRAAAQARQCAL